MARYTPGSQTRDLLDEKQRIAMRLLAQGLTVTQITQQLRCSRYLVRQAQIKMEDIQSRPAS